MEPEHKKQPNWVVISLLILLLLLGLLLGWMWWKDKDKSTPATEEVFLNDARRSVG